LKRRIFLQNIAFSQAALLGFPNVNLPFGNDFPADPVRDDRLKRFGDGRDWFYEKRFGFFVHWGIYSIPGWHEQHMYRTRMPRKEYEKLMHQFNPVLFNPDEWLDLMESAGMKYICFTTRHIDGFCMWNTSQTSFKITNTPYGRDVLSMLAEACHRRKVPLCLYYSVVDNHHGNYPNQGRAHELSGPEEGDQPDQEKYMNFMKNQVRELCTNYGEIHGFWWDANRLGLRDPSVNQMIRQLQPKAVINNRGFDEGDFSTPERDFEKDDRRSFDRLTEACQSVGIESWGYRKNEDYYSDRHLIGSIDKYLARGANYLLNAGPDATGIIPSKSSEILKRIGGWYASVRESLENVQPASHLTTNNNVLLTSRGNNLYVHLCNLPEGNVVKLKPFTVAPKSAVLLNNKQNVIFELELAPQDFVSGKSYLRLINLPVNEFCNTVLVIKLEFDRPPENYAKVADEEMQVK
jgi:alpha-L-fucosidase